MIWMDACDALSRLKRFVLSFKHVLTYVSPLCVCLSASHLAFINDSALALSGPLSA